MVNGCTDNVPIGPGLIRQDITSNIVLSQKRADNVMNFMTSQGVNPSLVSTPGFRRCRPRGLERHAGAQAQNRRVELTLASSGN
jgi:chemotaxis protein MotB